MSDIIGTELRNYNISTIEGARDYLAAFLINKGANSIVFQCFEKMDLTQEFATTKAKLELALKAMDFYGNKDNWMQSKDGKYKSEGEGIYYVNDSPYLMCEIGKLAREIKKQIEEVK
jgi:hypothetical protein